MAADQISTALGSYLANTKVSGLNRPEIDDLDNPIGVNDTVIQLQISMRKTHVVEVLDTVQDLLETAINFMFRHLVTHHNSEQVIITVLQNLKQTIIFISNLNGLNDVLMS
ncbi:hypothetical protein WICPIJ_003285 [Wickerhamomyces pijperi]|uniref:Uncharacterized protein n=1 Tax=Wickerhamomyces pijperi TaxID=599730 RepID=A0A9P8Q867_WICPI|nr:hypothetical protein WICPIJ_003285 [Wickerhamomyces pijperi]